jgi:hypothetical protein
MELVTLAVMEFLLSILVLTCLGALVCLGLDPAGFIFIHKAILDEG